MIFPHGLAPFVPPRFGIKLAREPWEFAAHRALRRRVFCDEQQLFVESDCDEVDDVAAPIVAVDYVMSMAHDVVGTVRIHEASPGLWYGSRLAIVPEYRNVYGLGSGLVYRAVTTAHARGCRTFLANVQRRNVPFFRRMAWEALDEITLLGQPHTLMRADLAAYPPARDDGAVALLEVRRAS
ncbi:MAG: GNAT family N-acetyltransferase [Candidatus Eremiobacteraeota bacterium]|nr:GNAT family N-acetyltransferase [Candidatus Eremiobacteraeota bacterium]